MLILLLEVSKQYNLSKEQFYTLVLAVFYHDIVYIPGGKNNEDESFNICQFHLKQRFSIENVDKLLDDIQFLIECTRIENIGICHNSIPAALMSYMDIASLASDYFVFDDRQNDIIGEACSYHGSFDGGNEFTSKSVEFFEQLLKKKRIFPHHPNMDFSEQEKIARRNMERFIAECKV
jgi:predicted metal-dependent HD superfamily phosphohydrolase